MDKDSRPEISPYTQPSVALYFAGGCTLYISPHLLAQSHKLEALYLDNPLHVLDVSDAAGHVLIHYLITGTYQSLKPRNLSPQEEVAAEFSTSVRAYNAAKAYTLPILAEIAKAEIERLGKRLQFSLIFDLLREAYPNPDIDDVWLSSYLKNQLDIFLKSGLMKPQESEAAVPHKTVPINHILFKSMLELFQENTVSPCNETNDAFEETTGDRPAFQLVSGFLVDKPIVESNPEIGEPGRNLTEIDDTCELSSVMNKKKTIPAKLALRLSKKSGSEDISIQDIAASQNKKIEKDCSSNGPPKDKERKEEDARKAQKQIDRETEQAGKEAEERLGQEATKFVEEAAIAKEEAEIARLIDKRDNSFLGLNKSGEQRLHLLEARAKERAEQQAAHKAEELAKAIEQTIQEARAQTAQEAKCKAVQHEVREVEGWTTCKGGQTAIETEQAAKEDKGKGRKGKRNKKSNRNISNNMTEVDPLPGQVEDFLVVKTQQEAELDDKENKDDTRALHGQKTSQGEKKEKVSETSAPVVHSSDGNPAIDSGQETKLNDDKEDMEEDGWGLWGFRQK